MDLVIPADILTALLVIGLAIVPTWLVLRWAGRAVARKRARAIWPNWPVDPDAPDGGGWDDGDIDSGDQGGMPEPIESPRPEAPDIGSGQPVGCAASSDQERQGR